LKRNKTKRPPLAKKRKNDRKKEKSSPSVRSHKTKLPDITESVGTSGKEGEPTEQKPFTTQKKVEGDRNDWALSAQTGGGISWAKVEDTRGRPGEGKIKSNEKKKLKNSNIKRKEGEGKHLALKTPLQNGQKNSG